MNESFFDQYAVFCVFGSVVGCVVIPLMVQMFKQQSMECVMLSVIVVSLCAAAHWKKKATADQHAHFKVLTSKEYDKRKSNSGPNKKQQQHKQYAKTTSQQQDQEFVQQHEYLRVIEVERRNEEKKLKKQRKREERLKRKKEEKGEAYRKEKEQGELCRNSRTKRNSYHKETLQKIHKDSSVDAFCNCASSKVTLSKNWNTTPYFARIPRFERVRVKSTDTCSPTVLVTSRTHQTPLQTSLSVSCSSLSSISSSDSCSPPSPPPFTTPSNGKPAWNVPKLPTTIRSATSAKRSFQSPCGSVPFNVGADGSTVVTSLGFSSSLFCGATEQATKTVDDNHGQPEFVDQYTLFGYRRFPGALLK